MRVPARRPALLVFAAVSLFGAAGAASGQTVNSPLVYGTASGGIGTGGVAGLLSFHVAPNRWSFEARGAGVEELDFFGPTPTEFTTDIGFLFGRVYPAPRRLATLAVGISRVHAVKRARLSPWASAFSSGSCVRGW